MITREEIINQMCFTWRHDFGLDKTDSCLLTSGMTPQQREFLWADMAQIFDNVIAPNMIFKSTGV